MFLTPILQCPIIVLIGKLVLNYYFVVIDDAKKEKSWQGGTYIFNGKNSCEYYDNEQLGYGLMRQIFLDFTLLFIMF